MSKAKKGLKNFFKKISKLPRPKRLVYKILFLGILFLILLVFVYGLGIYKFNFSRYGTKKVIKVIPYPAAIFNSSLITVNQVEKQKDYIFHFYQRTNTNPPAEDVLKKEILDKLVEEKIVKKEAKKYGIFVTKKEIEDKWKEVKEQNQGEENVKKMLEDLYGMSIKDFKKMIENKLIVEKFKNEALASVHVYHILIKHKRGGGENKEWAGQRAWEIINNNLNKGEDFSELAKKFSEDENSKDKGGDLGFIQKDMAPEPFVKMVFSLKENEIAKEPVFTDEYGFHIIKVTEKKGKIEKSYQDWLKEIKEKTKVRKFVGK